MASRALGSLTVDLIARTFGFEQGMDKAARTAAKRSKEIDRAISGAFKSAAGSISQFVAGFATVDFVMRSFMQAVDVADRIDELSNRLGISSEQLSKWGYAAKLSGSDLESLASALPKLSKNLAAAMDAGSKQGGLFDALGIDVTDARGRLRDVEAIIPEIADAFKGLQNDTLEAAVAQELFGRSGAELLEFLNRGSAGIKEFGDELESLGGVIDQETGAAAAEFKDEVDRLRVALNGAWTEIARELLPILTELVDGLKQSTTAGDGVAKAAKDIAAIASVLADVIGLVGNEFAKSDEVGSSFRATLGFLSDAGESLKGAFDSLLRLDVAGWFQGMTQYASGAVRAIRAAFGQLDRPDFSNVRTNPNFGNVQSGANTIGAANPAEARLNRLLSEGRGGAKKSGKSEEEKEAERLQKAYESLIESMDERIALFGKEGEAAKVRYDTEFGSLVGLTAELKANAIARAEQYDQMVLSKELQDAAYEAVQKETEAYRQQQEVVTDMISDMEFELALIGMGNAEREREIALRYAGAAATEEQRARILELVDAQREAVETAQRWDAVQSSLSNSMYDAISGAESLTDAVKGFFDELNAQILRMITEGWAEQITDLFRGASKSGGSGGGNGWMDMLSSIFGSFGGGKAAGGAFGAGRFYEVNESGMEMATVRGRDYLLTGNSSGTITPAHKVGGGMAVTQNFINPIMADRRSDTQREAEAARRLRRVQRYA